MLPFDNKSEFQVVLDLPEGTTLETTAALGPEMAHRLAPRCPKCEHRGVRRNGGAVQLQRPGAALLPAPGRQRRRRAGQSRSPRATARGRVMPSPWRCVPAIDSIARRYDASAKVAEIPPGPPVLSTLVAEVYAGRTTPAGSGGERVKAGVRVHAGRGGCGLDRGGAAAAAGAPGGRDPRRRGWGERGADHAGRPSGPVGRSGRPGQPARRPRGRDDRPAAGAPGPVQRRSAAGAAGGDGRRSAAARAIRPSGLHPAGERPLPEGPASGDLRHRRRGRESSRRCTPSWR